MKRHQKIMEFANQVDLFNEYSDSIIAIRIEGFKGLYRRCNSSLEFMLDLFKEKYAGGDRRKMNGHYYSEKREIQTYFSYNIVRLT